MMLNLHPTRFLSSPFSDAAPQAYTACWDGSTDLTYFIAPLFVVAVATAIAAQIWFSGRPASYSERLRQLALFVAGGIAWVFWILVFVPLAPIVYVLGQYLTSPDLLRDGGAIEVAQMIAAVLPAASVLVAVAIPGIALLQSKTMRRHVTSVVGSGPSLRRIALFSLQGVSGMWLPLAIMLAVMVYYRLAGDPCAPY